MKTNQQLEEQINLVGTRVAEMESFLCSLALSQANLAKLIAANVDNFTLAEREVLTTSAQKALADVERLKSASRHFQASVEVFLRS
jgi:hypothetical protein